MSDYNPGSNIKNEPFEDHSIETLKIDTVMINEEPHLPRRFYDALNSRYDIAQKTILSLRVSEDELAQALGKKCARPFRI